MTPDKTPPRVGGNPTSEQQRTNGLLPIVEASHTIAVGGLSPLTKLTEQILERLHDSLKLLVGGSRTAPRHVLSELLQNADDASATWARTRLVDGDSDVSRRPAYEHRPNRPIGGGDRLQG